MKLETNRLQLREFNIQDVNRFSQYRNKPEVAKYQTWSTYSKFKALRRIRYCLKHPFSGLPGNYQIAVCLKENNYLIGDIFLAVDSPHSILLGYTFDSDYWHRGYAYEALKSLLEYLKELKFIIVYCEVCPENLPSIRLLEKLGLEARESSRKERLYTKYL